MILGVVFIETTIESFWTDPVVDVFAWALFALNEAKQGWSSSLF